MATPTLRAQVAALTESVATLEGDITVLLGAISKIVVAPVATPAPVKAQAKSAAFGDRTFDEYVEVRRAQALGCEIHAAATCNRTFSPKSSGRTNHVARIV